MRVGVCASLAILAGLVLVWLAMRWLGRSEAGHDQAAIPSAAPGVAAPAGPAADPPAPTRVDAPAKRIEAVVRERRESKYVPQPGDDRGTKQIKRVQAALIQKFLETAPVAEHEVGRLMELLLRRGARVSAAEKAAIDAELRAMVGEEYFAEIESSSNRVNVRLYGIEFIGEALWRGEPLTAEQSARGKFVPGPTGLTDFDVKVLERMREVLSREQMRILEEVRKEIAKEE